MLAKIRRLASGVIGESNQALLDIRQLDAVADLRARAEVQKLVRQADTLGLKIIPRGGGTGLTGGAIPVHPETLVINLEKLSRIDGIERIQVGEKEIPVVTVGAGTVTVKV